jgi:hypothetical protein
MPSVLLWVNSFRMNMWGMPANVVFPDLANYVFSIMFSRVIYIVENVRMSILKLNIICTYVNVDIYIYFIYIFFIHLLKPQWHITSQELEWLLS